MSLYRNVDDSDRSRVVELPFQFGDVLYHKARTDRHAGVVVGFKIYPEGLQIQVRWGDDLGICDHWPFELTATYEPINPGS